MYWLKNHWIGLLSLFLTALYLYFQLREWQRHGDDFVPLARTLLVTVILWVILVIAIGRYVVSSGRLVHSESRIAAIEKAGTLKSYAGQADWLAKRLEEVWHLFNNEQKKLMYPLGVNVIPEVIKEWPDKQLLEFRVLYRSHIGALKKIDPDYHSTLVDEGFPCNGEDYLAVKRKIEAHADLLRTRARDLLKSK